MTQQRRDNHSTEFGLWLRNQRQESAICPQCSQEIRENVGERWRNPDQIDSKYGYTTSNIDFLWRNYKNGLWMLIEEKRKGKKPERWQREMFEILDKSIKDSNYKGFHTIVFENTSPEDGKIYLDDELVTKEQLVKFLSFEEYKDAQESRWWPVFDNASSAGEMWTEDW
jgi:hypothetical protein